MSPKNEVLPLVHISLSRVSTLLVHCLCDDEGVNYGPAEHYLSDATNDVLQDLLKAILSAETLDASTRFSCLAVILREDIKRLDVGVFPHSYYEKILDVVVCKGVGLQHLNLKGVWLREYPERLSELLKELKHLKVLSIPHMPDDDVLETVMGLHHLTVLDISGECAFTQEGLKSLVIDNLKVLSIGMYGKKNICENMTDDYQTVAELIKSHPHLNILKTYSFTGQALSIIYKENPHYKTKLKYIHDTGTTTEILEAMKNLCPDLESINFCAPQAKTLRSMGCLKRLNCLKMSEVDSTELIEYLKGSGDKVLILKLNLLRGSTLDVSQLCTLTPELKTLECYKSKVICLNLDTYFVNLESIEVLYCEASDSFLKYLLLNSPFLRRFVIGDVVRMTDGDIFRLCAESGFNYLEELWFSSARSLTCTTVELLMGHCPNLRVLGQLTGWDIQPTDIDYLRAIILSTNTDLTLLPLEMIG